MKKYKFSNEVIIEAENEDQAIEKFADQADSFAPNARREEVSPVGVVSFENGLEKTIPSHGTEKYYRAGALNNILLTEGVLLMCDNYGAHWLVDVVSSYVHRLKNVDQSIVFVILKHTPKPKQESAFTFYIQDDIPANNVYAEQYIPMSDFPRNGVKLFLGKTAGSSYILCLPQEN